MARIAFENGFERCNDFLVRGGLALGRPKASKH